MKSLRETLGECRARKVALGHFNVSDTVTLKAIFAAATELGVPVMVGVSEGERDFMGIRQVIALVKSLREEYDYPIYLNADHTHSIEKLEVAVRAGFDEVIFDASTQPFEENLKQTKLAVELAKTINPDVVVEGEIGFIGSGSEILDKVPDQAALAEAALTKPEEALRFVMETKIDVLAPAVGNMHGLLVSMLTGAEHKKLNIERIKALADTTGSFMTLHGGSGTSDEGFAAAIKAGMTIVHVSTELRVAWRRGVEAGLAKDAHEVAPYKLLAPAYEGIREVVKSHLKLFNNL